MAGSARPSPADFEAAGLVDRAAADAAQRLKLLEHLIALGATLDDLVATPPDDLPKLAATIALWGGRQRLTIGQVALAANVDDTMVARVWRAAGFPDPAASPDVATFSPRDVELLEIMQAAIVLFGEDVTIQLVRVLGASAARVADASLSAFFVSVVPDAVSQDSVGLALARANSESMAMLDGLTRGFDTMLRHHLERAFRPAEELIAVPDVDLVRRSVGFADLVDSTVLSQRLDPPRLSRVLSDFDASVSEIVVAGGGRVVKLIGDEVMFVAGDAMSAVDIALELIATFREHDVLPPIRVGIATGEVLARDGDYSGVVVNLAARAATVATPSSLFVDPVTRDSLQGQPQYECVDAEQYELKGFADPIELTRIDRAR